MPPAKESELAELTARMARLESAVFGNPADPKSVAILPTMARLSAYLDAACWAWRAAIAAVPICTGLFAAGRAMAWW